MKYIPILSSEDITHVKEPMERCCYCWYTLHPQVDYPASWSSTICEEHVVWMKERYVTQRKKRLVS